MVNVDFKKLAPEAKLPKYASEEAAGFDLCALGKWTIAPGRWMVIPTGLAMAMPVGYEAQIRSRSGLAAKHGIAVLNSPGTVDSDYRGEIKIILINHSQETFSINDGDRIAQMVIAKCERAELWEKEELGNTIRGTDGLGSTGVK